MVTLFFSSYLVFDSTKKKSTGSKNEEAKIFFEKSGRKLLHEKEHFLIFLSTYISASLLCEKEETFPREIVLRDKLVNSKMYLLITRTQRSIERERESGLFFLVLFLTVCYTIFISCDCSLLTTGNHNIVCFLSFFLRYK